MFITIVSCFLRDKEDLRVILGDYDQYEHEGHEKKFEIEDIIQYPGIKSS